MIDTPSNAGPRLAFEVCLIFPHCVPGVPTPKDAAALADEVAEAERLVEDKDGVTVMTASVGEEVALVGSVALADERTLGQNPSPHLRIPVE